jgi:hypothetical protein
LTTLLDILPGGVLIADPHCRRITGNRAFNEMTACWFLSDEMPAVCPRCQAPCAEASLWEEILLFTLRHDIAVHCLTAAEALARHGGMAAILARKEADLPAGGEG